MAGSKTAYAEAVVLAHLLGGASMPSIATWYVVLSTEPFDPDATGSACDECAAADYAREAVTNNTTNFPAPTGSNPATSSNGTSIAWPTATNDWGTIQSAYLADASTGGNLWYGGDLAAPVPVGIGSSAAFPPGQLIVTEL